MKKAGGKCSKASIVLAVLLLVCFLAAFLFYAGLRKEFLLTLSERLSSYAGQPIEIGNLSVSPPGNISLHDVSVRNPRGFTEGELLHLKRLSFSLDLGGLFRGRIHLKGIYLDTPQCFLLKNERGRLNISDKLLQSFSKKSSFRYRVDEISIRSGTCDFNNDPRLRIGRIGLILKNLSSERGEKTVFQGSTVYEGGKLDLKGCVYLNDEPKKVGISVTADHLNPPSSFEGIYGIGHASRGSLRLDAEGDAGKGFRVSSVITIENPVFPFLKGGIRRVQISSNSFLDLTSDTLLLRDASVSADGLLSASLSGAVRNLRNSPVFDGGIRSGRIDLSFLSVSEGFHLSGVATTRGLKIKGPLRRAWPEISGAVGLAEGSLVSEKFEMREIEGVLEFPGGRRPSVQAGLYGQLRRAGDIILKAPSKMRASLDMAVADGGSTAIEGTLSLSPMKTTVKNKDISLGGLRFSAAGNLREKAFSGKVSFESGSLISSGISLGHISGSMQASFAQKRLELERLKVKSKEFVLDAGKVSMYMPSGGKRLEINGNKMDALFTESKSGVRGLDIRAALDLASEPFRGNFRLDSGSFFIRGIEAGTFSAEGRTGTAGFHIAVPAATFFNGKVSLFVDSVSAGVFLPLRLRLRADSLDAGLLSRTAADDLPLPYEISGTISKASFDGIVHSAKSLTGEASLTSDNLSVSSKEPRRSLLKASSLSARGRLDKSDLGFEGEIKTGNVLVEGSGTLRDFASADRKANFRAVMPPVAASDIREAFWDIFPDSMLYAALEGALSSDLSIDYTASGTEISGSISLKGFSFTEENGRFFIGAVNGVLPISYESRAAGNMPEIPLFDVGEFENLRKHYDRMPEGDLSRISIGSFRYGFDVLDGMELLVSSRGAALNVERFSANIFGGKLRGSAAISLSGRPNYRAGFILEGLSLRRLCDTIDPVRGYLSGMVDGVAMLKGSGAGLSDVLGKADFWTYDTEVEKRVISKEFLRKMGGPSLGSYMTDRPFDKGVMSLYLQNGFVVFKKLEIAHKNFLGMTDLSVKVAPFNNRISLSELLWSITEAAQRANKGR